MVSVEPILNFRVSLTAIGPGLVVVFCVIGDESSGGDRELYQRGFKLSGIKSVEVAMLHS